MRIITTTGSVYTVIKENNKWWLSAKNVPNPTSGKLEGMWEIQEPKIKIGQSAELISAYVNDRDNPLRMPGGGKITSPVIMIEE